MDGHGLPLWLAWRKVYQLSSFSLHSTGGLSALFEHMCFVSVFNHYHLFLLLPHLCRIIRPLMHMF